MTSFQERSKNVQDQILSCDYWVDNYKRALVHHNMTVGGIKLYSYLANDLQMMWNNFWWSLPDAPQIRRQPFFDICDLCEEDLRDPLDDLK